MYASQIEQRGIMVFDNVTGMPLYDEPYTTTLMTISISLSGWVRLECDMKPVVFRERDVVVLSPQHILCAREVSPDYKAILIVLSEDCQMQMRLRFPDIYSDSTHYTYQPHLSLTQAQAEDVQLVFRAMQAVSRTNGPRRMDMAAAMFEVLFMMLKDYRTQNGIATRKPSPREELFTRFYNAIVDHHHESREVRFYAEMLCMTPKHFAIVIKEHTGMPASEWINSYVVIQAKSMLRHERQLTIQQIALQLGFPDQATFSRYFRHHTGMSPTEYRAQS